MINSLLEKLTKKGFNDVDISEYNSLWSIALSNHDEFVLRELQHKHLKNSGYINGFKNFELLDEWVDSLPEIKEDSKKFSLSKKVDIDIYFRRCVYINDYRVVGGKPYVTENLPKHTHECSVKSILDSLELSDILNYIEYKQSKV